MAEHLGHSGARDPSWPCSGVVSSQLRGAPCKPREKRHRDRGVAATQEQAQKHSWSCTRKARERVTGATVVNQGWLPRCRGKAQHPGPQGAAESRRGPWEDHPGPPSRHEWGVGEIEGVRKDLAGLSISLFVCPLATVLSFHGDPRWTDR